MNRRRRFTRSEPIPMAITPRDVAILDAVARHRFLDSRQIVALVEGSPQHIIRRLQKLFLAGYLDRPRAQINYYEAGMRPMVYELGRIGRKLLSDSSEAKPIKRDPVGRFYMEHTLLVAAVSLAFHRAEKSRGKKATRAVFAAAAGGKPWPFKWSVNVRNKVGPVRVGVCPDLTLAATDEHGKRLLLFIEADRGTMPITRRSLAQTSFLRKLLAYEATWTQRLTKDSHGAERFRVLTVTRSAARAKKLAETCAEIEGGRGLFLFTNIAALEKSGDVFSHEWLSGRGGTDRIFGA